MQNAIDTFFSTQPYSAQNIKGDPSIFVTIKVTMADGHTKQDKRQQIMRKRYVIVIPVNKSLSSHGIPPRQLEVCPFRRWWAISEGGLKKFMRCLGCSRHREVWGCTKSRHPSTHFPVTAILFTHPGQVVI